MKFLKNDGDAFKVLYIKGVNELYSYGLGMGYSSDVCKDAIQDVFYKIYIQRNKLYNILNFKLYLFKCFKNRLVDIEKQKKHFIEIDHCHSLNISVSMLEDIINKEEKDILKKKINELLEQLTDKQKEALYLRYMQELDYAEIAEIMKINIDSARKLVYRSLENIRNNQLNIATFILIQNLF